VLVRVGVSPPSNTEHDFHVAVLRLEERQLLHGAVYIFANVIPRIVGIVDISVCPGICEEDSAILPVVGEGVKNMGKLVRRDVVGEELARVDVPVTEVANSSVAITGRNSGRCCYSAGR
jgi:hypothetical protein